jgi:hypothetical protein
MAWIMNLYKFLFIFLLACGSGGIIAAQDEPSYFTGEKTFYGGLVIGMNCSQVDGDTYSGFHSVGLNTGAMVYWQFSKPLALSVEFLYSQKGSRSVTQTSSPYAGPYFSKYKIRLNYVEAPLLFHYIISPKYQLGLGGSFNALLGSKESFTAIYPIHIDESQAAFNKYTFDLIGSVSMMLWKGIMLSARYQYGITPLRSWDHVPVFQAGMGTRDQYNNMATFRIAYLF